MQNTVVILLLRFGTLQISSAFLSELGNWIVTLTLTLVPLLYLYRGNVSYSTLNARLLSVLFRAWKKVIIVI